MVITSFEQFRKVRDYFFNIKDRSGHDFAKLEIETIGAMHLFLLRNNVKICVTFTDDPATAPAHRYV